MSVKIPAQKIYSFIIYLDEREFCLARLLVDEVVVVLGRDVERVALLRVELRRVQYHRDLPLQDHENLRADTCSIRSLT